MPSLASRAPGGHHGQHLSLRLQARINREKLREIGMPNAEALTQARGERRATDRALRTAPRSYSRQPRRTLSCINS